MVGAVDGGGEGAGSVELVRGVFFAQLLPGGFVFAGGEEGLSW